jgi:hypothetical protein
MGRRETGHKGGRTVRGTRGLRVVLRPGQMGALAVGGYKHSRGREREREPYAPARSPARPTFSYESPGPSFYRRKERVQVYNGGVAVSAFRPRGVPGPTSKLSPRAPAQMGRRETEREGGKT